MLTPQSFNLEIANRKLILETGKLAGQASGAVTLRYGDTLVLVTACVGGKPRQGVDFLPLTVDYEERLYAAGKIPGGFIRREGRPSEDAILASRLTDRPLRPLLPKQMRNDVQVVITVLSVDQENDPDILAVIGGSAALTLSEVPFAGPVGAVRVGYINGQMVLNPTMPQLEESRLDLVVVSTEQTIAMIEAGAKEVSEEIVLSAIKFGHEANQGIIRLQKELQQACGKPKMEIPKEKTNPELVAVISPMVNDKLIEVLNQSEKSIREQLLETMQKEALEDLEQTFSEEEILSTFEARVKAEVRANMLEKGRRFSGRGFEEIRPITCEVGVLPRTHGSALFTRGQTQVLTITTLGSLGQEQKLDGLGIEETKRFMHHYNFPPFSTGEAKRMGSPGRREIGHGALAERALLPILPGEGDFLYTIRLVSEVLSSSGSTSMASVCASSLSLMDAGVPIKSPVAGIAMGLVTNDKGDYVILTDIEGVEDAYGDMDFKVAGTKEGITAIQMDTKLQGIKWEVVEKTLHQAKVARTSILGIMENTISSSRSELSPYAPRMYKITIPQDKIGDVIGSGGKTIRAIIEDTGASIDIENDGTVIIGSSEEKGARRAIEIIEGLTKEAEIGTIYTGKVTRILPFGAMVEILPGKEGLVHISELADYRVAKVEDIVKVGDEVTVKVIEVDHMGRVNLSRKALFETSERAPSDRKRESFPPRTGGQPFRRRMDSREPGGQGNPRR